MQSKSGWFGRAVGGAAVVLWALGSSAAVTHAQQSSAGPGGNTLFTINPLGLPFKYFSTELERKITPLATLGGALSYLDVDDVSYFTLEAKLRIYPNEEAFRGFSIGVGAGLTRLAEDAGDTSEELTAPTISVIADYNWLLGKSKRVVVGTGIGAKRIFGDDDNFSDANFAYPTARFQIGLTF